MRTRACASSFVGLFCLPDPQQTLLGAEFKRSRRRAVVGFRVLSVVLQHELVGSKANALDVPGSRVGVPSSEKLIGSIVGIVLEDNPVGIIGQPCAQDVLGIEYIRKGLARLQGDDVVSPWPEEPVARLCSKVFTIPIQKVDEQGGTRENALIDRNGTTRFIDEGEDKRGIMKSLWTWPAPTGHKSEVWLGFLVANLLRAAAREQARHCTKIKWFHQRTCVIPLKAVAFHAGILPSWQPREQAVCWQALPTGPIRVFESLFVTDSQAF